MKKHLLIILSLALLVPACASKQTPPAALAGSWKLQAVGPAEAPVPAVADAKGGITFNEDGTLSGNSGCNSFGGEYMVKGDRITFGQIVSTLMGCDEPRMTQEQAVHQVLTGTVTFKIDGNMLTLKNQNMVIVLTR